MTGKIAERNRNCVDKPRKGCTLKGVKDGSAPTATPAARITVLLAAALLATALAPIHPAAARDGSADNLPLYSACVGPAANPAGFADVPLVFQEAVDCLAHYRITLGRSPDRYEPGAVVTRAQMARFLIRAALPAGIEITTADDQGFTDIGHLPSGTVSAVNQLAALGVARGRTRTTFAPGEPVTRSQMAQFLARFLRAAPVGPGGQSIENVRPDDEIFTDVGGLNQGAYDDIRRLYEMGVTTGTDYNAFSPERSVTRGQMAAFITRALAHTQARPAGVTLQAETLSATAGDRVRVAASVRTEDHAPFLDRSVDVFTARVANLAIGRDGKCFSSVVTGFPNNSGACLIDRGDGYTDGQGNYLFTLSLPNSLTVWAWAGDEGDEFDADQVEYHSLRFMADKGASALRITDDMREGALRVAYGTPVTFTFQVVDEDGTEISRRGISIRLSLFVNRSGVTSSGRPQTLVTDSSGRAVRVLRYGDPSSSRNDFTKVELNVSAAGLGVEDESTLGVVRNRRTVDWDDATAVPTSLIIEQQPPYHRATSSGSGPTNDMTVSLIDQYGSPVRGARVNVWSDRENGLGGSETDPAISRNTNSRGVLRISYSRDSSAGTVEKIVARTADGAISKAERHYWAEEPNTGTYENTTILYKNPDNGVLVASTAGEDPEILLFAPDDNDQYFDAAGAPISYDRFREEVEEEDATQLTANIRNGEVNRFYLV